MARARLLLLPVLLAACACSVSYQPSASPTPTPRIAGSPLPVADYNRRLGTNRAAAEAAAQIGRQLAAQSGYWDVSIRTHPDALQWSEDAAFQETQRARVTEVTAVMATEAGPAVRSFRAGGRDHEEAVVKQIATALQALFRSAISVQVLVFFGESEEHAVGTAAGGKFTYRVLDGL